MADRMFHPGGIATLDRSLVELFGVVTLGAAAIASQSCLGFTVTRTGAGAYTITLDDKYSQLLFPGITIGHATPEDKFAEFISETVDSTRTVLFQTWDVSAGAAGDLASGGKIFIRLVLLNTGVPRKGA